MYEVCRVFQEDHVFHIYSLINCWLQNIILDQTDNAHISWDPENVIMDLIILLCGEYNNRAGLLFCLADVSLECLA